MNCQKDEVVLAAALGNSKEPKSLDLFLSKFKMVTINWYLVRPPLPLFFYLDSVEWLTTVFL
jgi:hypothetical protein